MVGICLAFWGSFWPSVWDTDATLDVWFLPIAVETADGDDLGGVRRINVDRRRGITVASSDQSACAGDITTQILSS